MNCSFEQNLDDRKSAKEKLGCDDCCYMCKCSGEIVDNLLFHRPIAIELWSMEFGLFGVYWVMPDSAVQLLASWQGQLGHHQNIAIWKAILRHLMWCIWREHNA